MRDILNMLKFRRIVKNMHETEFLRLCELRNILSEGRLVLNGRLECPFFHLYETGADRSLRIMVSLGQL
jgi:hypothetical protein